MSLWAVSAAAAIFWVGWEEGNPWLALAAVLIAAGSVAVRPRTIIVLNRHNGSIAVRNMIGAWQRRERSFELSRDDRVTVRDNKLVVATHPDDCLLSDPEEELDLRGVARQLNRQLHARVEGRRRGRNR